MSGQAWLVSGFSLCRRSVQDLSTMNTAGPKKLTLQISDEPLVLQLNLVTRDFEFGSESRNREPLESRT